jgi:hypothetical protein
MSEGATEERTWDAFSVLTTLTLINFVVFLFIAFHVGGDALNGHVDGERWMIRGHGGYMEVTRGFWIYSFVHALATIGSFLVVFVWYFVKKVWRND